MTTLEDAVRKRQLISIDQLAQQTVVHVHHVHLGSTILSVADGRWLVLGVDGSVSIELPALHTLHELSLIGRGEMQRILADRRVMTANNGTVDANARKHARELLYEELRKEFGA